MNSNALMLVIIGVLIVIGIADLVRELFLNFNDFLNSTTFKYAFRIISIFIAFKIGVIKVNK